MFEIKQNYVNAAYPVQYILTGNESSDHLYILLHGFMEKASKMVKRLQMLLPEDSLILAPNGPFPLPEKRPQGYKVRYAWYFFDNIKNSYLIDYEFPATLVANLVEDLGLKGKKITLIGYSQGGYLAPFISMKLDNIVKIIGMACVFKHNLFPTPIKCPFIQIHSKDDKMVSYSGSKKHFNEISKSYSQGTFLTLEKAGHLYNELYEDKLKKALSL